MNDQTPERCQARNDNTGGQCGRVKGHDADHTTLIESQFLKRQTWTEHATPEASEPDCIQEVDDACMASWKASEPTPDASTVERLIPDTIHLCPEHLTWTAEPGCPDASCLDPDNTLAYVAADKVADARREAVKRAVTIVQRECLEISEATVIVRQIRALSEEAHHD